MDTIKTAKTELQKKIIAWDFITSIGSREEKPIPYIEIGITDKKYSDKIEELLTDGKWMGFKVNIKVSPFSSFQ